jgi:hypothetical protein
VERTVQHAGAGRLARRLWRTAATPGPSGADGGAVLGPVAHTVGTGRTGRVLAGDWLGHAAHPMLTDFTTGPWMAASFLDLFGPPGSAPAARRLVGLGLLAAVPTWLSGASEWRRTDGATRRVGLVHAVGSSLATALYAGSYVARRRGGRRAGVLLGLLGGVVEIADGYVGGELTLIGGAGTGRRGD